jgi:hypothetical protein
MPKSPIQALENLKKKVKASKKPLEPKQAKVKVPSPQMMLPLWPQAVRGIPNAVLRGALFTVSQRRATFKKMTLLTSVEGVDIRFKGERFNQTDLDVYEMLLHLAREQPVGNRVEFSVNSLLKELGRKTGKTQHDQLHEEITRLRGGTVEMVWTADKQRFFGGLIVKGFRDDNTGRYVVELEPDIVKLYEHGYSHIDWQQRKALGNNNLAKWLHGFFSTHAQPFPYKVETIKSLSGSTVERLADFKKMLKQALKHLVEVKAITDWVVDENDLVHVKRLPSSSQQRHIMKNSTGRVRHTAPQKR